MAREPRSDEVRTLSEKFKHDWQAWGRPNEDLIPVMEYISENTGLLKDYHEGDVYLGEGGEIIQWYGRGRTLSRNNRLLQWVQAQPRVHLAVVAVRDKAQDGELKPVPYAEIHPDSRWE